MPLFLVRIELHGTQGDQNAYQRLHAAMEVAGFQRYVTYSDGKSFWLPTAEYLIEAATGSFNAVRQKATAAARVTGYRHLAFICEIFGMHYCSSNLVEKK